MKLSIYRLINTLLCLTPLFSSCQEVCESPGIYARFRITDKTTGKPYYQVSKDSPDSLRIYEDEYPANSAAQPIPYVNKIVEQNGDYSFGIVDLYSIQKVVYYFYFNKNDIDTLNLSAIVREVSVPCVTKQSTITATYNGRLLKTVSSDTTGMIDFILFK